MKQLFNPLHFGIQIIASKLVYDFMANDKIQLIHPEGKSAPAIKLATYKLFEKAILNTLKIKESLTYTDIASSVQEEFSKKKIDFEGSVEWYSVCVKQHLESQGVIETFIENDKKMHRLKK